MNRISFSSACATLLLLGIVTVASSQAPSSQPIAAPRTGAAASDPTTAAEKEKIWNSPTMLRARAWVQEYCQRSAKITPAQEKEYMTELQNLSPVQMKLWLLKFDHEEEMIRRQQADFERSRQAGVSQALTVDRNTEKAYADINRGENEAAQTEEQSVRTQDALAAQRSSNKQDELSADASGADSLGGYWGYGVGPGFGYAPYGAYGGGQHIHVHVYPQ